MTILAAALALGLSGSDLMAAKKKGGDRGDSKKGKKEQVHRGSSRGHVASRGPSKRSAPPRHVASSKSKPKSHHVASSRSKGRSRADDHRVASHRLASASPRHHVEKAKKTIHRDPSPSKGNRMDRARALAANRDRHIDRRDIGSSVRRSNDDDRRRVASRAHDHDNDRRSVASRSHAGHNHSDRGHRDRSRYTERHEHHDHNWYASNGWEYDRDYYQTHRRHRYYNDLLSAFIFDVGARPSYGYDPAPQRYYGGGYSSTYDYETRVAVQEELARAGYYDGGLDGVIGSGTRSAIYNYQLDNGLAATGRIDDELLQSLGLI